MYHIEWGGLQHEVTYVIYKIDLKLDIKHTICYGLSMNPPHCMLNA